MPLPCHVKVMLAVCTLGAEKNKITNLCRASRVPLDTNTSTFMYHCTSRIRHIREINETSHTAVTWQKNRRRKKKSSIPIVNIHSACWQYGAWSSCYSVRYSEKKAHNHSVKTPFCMPRRNAGNPPISQEFEREVGIWRSASGNGGSLFKGASNSEG